SVLNRPHVTGDPAQTRRDLVDRDAPSPSDVVHIAIARGQDERIRARDILDEYVIPLLIPVAVDDQWFSLNNAPAENRHDPGFAVRTLARPVDVRIPKDRGLE